jgi:DNA-binding transcriptional LysR family regulator
MDQDPEGLQVHQLTTVEQVVVMTKEHRLAGRRRISIEALAGERLVLPPDGRPHRMMLEAAARSASVQFAIGAVARGWELAVKLVELEFGIAIVNGCCRVPRGLVKRANASRRLATTPASTSTSVRCTRLTIGARKADATT